MNKDEDVPAGTRIGHHATSDRVFEADEREFMTAMAEYQRESGRRFPPWSEVLRVVKLLGYTKETA
jgi:hypothetical protein